MFVNDDDVAVKQERSESPCTLPERRTAADATTLPAFNPQTVQTWRENLQNPKIKGQLVRLLAKTLIFGESSETFRSEIADRVIPVEYGPGQVVFRHGQPGDWLGICISGRLERKLQRQSKEIFIGDVGPGGLIGDLGVFGITPTRSFTVVCTSATVLLVLDKDALVEAAVTARCPYAENMLHDGTHMCNLMADVESFLNLKCFQGLDQDFVLTLRANSEPRVAYPGQVLMKENHFGDEMYILRAGKVKIWKNQKFVVELPAGVVLGELAVLGSDKRRTATVTCSSLVLIRALHADVFHEILGKFPAAKRVFDHAYVARLVSVEVNNAKEDMQYLDRFYGSASPRTTAEMQKLFGSTIKIDEKRSVKKNASRLPDIAPRKLSSVDEAVWQAAPQPP